MENKELIREMVKYQIYLMRWVERNTTLRCPNFRDMYNILCNGKLTPTYGYAVQNLEMFAKKYCNNKDMLEAISNLVQKVNNSTLKDLKFGCLELKHSDLERNLNIEVDRNVFDMITQMVSTKDASKLLGIDEALIKEACEKEILLNTQRKEGTWIVHISECRECLCA